MSRPREDKDLSVSAAFVEEKMTGSIDSGLDFHFMRFLMRVAIPDGHDQMIECVKTAIECWPKNLPAHHIGVARELLASLERKKREAQAMAAAKTADTAFVAALAHDGEDRFVKE